MDDMYLTELINIVNLIHLYQSIHGGVILGQSLIPG